jgi:hypothetical protein
LLQFYLSLSHPSFALELADFLQVAVDLFNNVSAAKKLIADVGQDFSFVLSR